MEEQSGGGVDMERGGEVDEIVSDSERVRQNRGADKKREEKVGVLHDVFKRDMQIRDEDDKSDPRALRSYITNSTPESPEGQALKRRFLGEGEKADSAEYYKELLQAENRYRRKTDDASIDAKYENIDK